MSPRICRLTSFFQFGGNIMRHHLNAIAALLFVVACGPAHATELKIASTVAFHGVLEDLAPLFSKETGVDVKLTFGGAAAVSKKVADGETFDLVILAPPVLDSLTALGKIDRSTVKALAQTDLGIAAKAGSPTRPVNSKEDFVAFLQDARSLGITDPASGAASSIFMANLLPTLGLSESVIQKVKWLPTGSFPKLVVSGDVDYWITQLSEIVPVASVTLVSRMPGALQNRTILSGGITTMANNPGDAARMLAFVLRSEAVLKSNGLEPI